MQEGKGFINDRGISHSTWERHVKGVEGHGKRDIAQVTTYLKTDIPEDVDRTEKERVRITKKGFLGNPGVDFSTISQHMTITSKHLTGALRALVKYYPFIRLDADPVELDSPFHVIVHHVEELDAYRVALSDRKQLASAPVGPGELPDTQHGVTINHLDQLLKFMRTKIFGRQLAAEQARYAQSPPVCTFSMLWLLYKPGTTVYVKDDAGNTSAYIMMLCDIYDEVSTTLERSDPYDVKLWSLTFDGTYVRRAMITVMIGSFDGECPIMDLNIVPASFVDEADGGKTRQNLIQRRRKWYGMLAGAQQWHYSGQTLDRATVRHAPSI